MPANIDVHIDHTTVRPNGSYTVEIRDELGVPLAKRDDLTVTINGVPVSRRTMQAPAQPGSHDITIRVIGEDRDETFTKTVTVAGEAITFARRTPKAIEEVPATLAATLESHNPYQVAFNLGAISSGAPTVAQVRPTIPDVAVRTPQKSVLPPYLNKALLGRHLGNIDVLKKSKGFLGQQPGSIEAIKVPEKAFAWDFGDGRTAEKTGTRISHDYSEAIDPHQVTMTFDVACTLPTGDAIKRTLVLHSAYGIARQLGSIVPMVSAPMHATATPTGFTAPITVSNIEYQAIQVTHLSVTPHTDDPHSPATPQLKKLGQPISIAPRTDAALAILLTAGIDIPENCTGFTLTFAGAAQRGLPVRFSTVFDIALEDQGQHQKVSDTGFDLDLIHKTLGDFLAKTTVEIDSKTPIADGIFHTNGPLHQLRLDKDQLGVTETLSEAILHADLNHKSPSKGRVSGLTGVQKRGGYPVSDRVAEGETCDPDNTSTAAAAQARDARLVCQLSGESEEVEVPARFLNARKGDIILSPGGAGLIGSLLRRVSPRQLYSHCGIMTRNYDEITHSTASIKRMQDYKVGLVKESDGYRADVVKYMWPGVVAQCVEAAINGEPWQDPDNGRTYTISSFSPYETLLTEEDVFELVPPLVLKPQPDLETSNVRAELHRVADAARADAGRPGQNSRSHYRLFAYTDPTIADTDTAPADAGWAAGTYPSVCSSFIWKMANSVGARLESASRTVMVQDLEESDLAEGAQVFPTTQDGLYAYTAEERLAAGQWLFGTIKRMVQDGTTPFRDFVTDASDDIANQLLNTFANDTTDKDSTAWRNVTSSSAVSPDNLMWWDGPERGGLWGFVEPVQYRPRRTETYQISRWRRAFDEGDLRGTVFIGGRPAPAAEVRISDELRARTGADGTFTIDNVPLGRYLLRASALVDGTRYSARTQVVMDDRVEDYSIVLSPPPQRYRHVRVNYDFHGRDDETFGGDEKIDPAPQLRTLNFGPDRLTGRFTETYKWGGELRAEYTFDFALLQDNSIRLNVHCSLYEGTSEGTGDLDGRGEEAVMIAPGATETLRLHVYNTDEDERHDFADMTVSIRNDRARN